MLSLKSVKPIGIETLGCEGTRENPKALGEGAIRWDHMKSCYHQGRPSHTSYRWVRLIRPG